MSFFFQWALVSSLQSGHSRVGILLFPSKVGASCNKKAAWFPPSQAGILGLTYKGVHYGVGISKWGILASYQGGQVIAGWGAPKKNGFLFFSVSLAAGRNQSTGGLECKKVGCQRLPPFLVLIEKPMPREVQFIYNNPCRKCWESLIAIASMSSSRKEDRYILLMPRFPWHTWSGKATKVASNWFQQTPHSGCLHFVRGTGARGFW